MAHRAGYPIRSKSNIQYVMDRIANSITPLYGDDGLYWQRFIAIPLQAQGKQGGSSPTSSARSRAESPGWSSGSGPFLKAAWQDRRDLPADELNGVVPLDSKFGFAWRDWRVLTEVAAADRARRLRTGRRQHRRHPRRAGRRQADRDASRTGSTASMPGG